MRAFEIKCSTNTDSTGFLEFNGRFVLSAEHIAKGMVQDKDGEKSCLYGCFNNNQFFFTIIPCSMNSQQKTLHFDFSNVKKYGTCLFNKQNFVENEENGTCFAMSLNEINCLHSQEILDEFLSEINQVKLEVLLSSTMLSQQT